MAKRKNSNGAGSIYKDKTTGRWVGAITVEIDDNGRARRRKVTGRTQAEARDRLDSLRRSLEVGDGLPAEMTVGRYLEHWTSEVLPLSDIAPTTRLQYETMTRLYLRPALGRKRLDKLSPADVRSMLAQLSEQGLSPATMRQARAVLGRALRTAEVDGLIARNPARLVDGVRQTNTEGRTLTPDQARTLLDGAQGHEYEALVAVLLSLGLRKGEALGLSWSDIDLDGTPPRLTIRQALKKGPKEVTYLDEPKTARSKRTIHLPAPLVETLRAHRVRQAEERLAFGPGWGGRWADDDLVFTTSVGTALDPNRVNRQVQQIARDAGLGKWTPHELRHSAASLLIAQGVPLKVVSEMLGHSSIRVTADVYGHLLDEARAEAATAMESALWG